MTHKHREEGADDYASPPSLWRPLARAVGGFDVDPASGAESTPIAETRFTRDENGLEQPWQGDVWLNPPFGDAPSTGPSKREKWLTKARNEANRDAVRSVTVLLPVDTSTQWFHNHVVEAPVLCLMGPGRLEFEGEKPEDTGNTSFATCIAVFGDPPEKLIESLEQFGAVFRGRSYFRSTVQRSLIQVTDGGNSPNQDTDRDHEEPDDDGLRTDGGSDVNESGCERQVVVSLCDQSGNMVRPWARAGYECYAVDLQNDGSKETVGDGTIHYARADVRKWKPPNRPVRIGFAFPPCTDLAVSGARWMREKGLSALAEAIEKVAACQEILDGLDCPWMLENPVSTLSTYWREPDYRFNPFEYDGYTERDEAYTKETCLWTGGGFRMPKPDGVDESDADDRIHKMPPSEDRSDRRSETPAGFAEAVYLVHDGSLEPRTGSGYEQKTLIPATDGGKARPHEPD